MQTLQDFKDCENTLSVTSGYNNALCSLAPVPEGRYNIWCYSLNYIEQSFIWKGKKAYPFS